MDRTVCTYCMYTRYGPSPRLRDILATEVTNYQVVLIVNIAYLCTTSEACCALYVRLVSVGPSSDPTPSC